MSLQRTELSAERPTSEETDTAAPPRARRRSRAKRTRRRGDPVSYSVQDVDDVEAESTGEPKRPAVPPVKTDVAIDEDIDADAARVVHRLRRAGYEAYMVGGCVRDALLGHTAKDFDVATDARPDDVRALFRNSRVIGRRFRLVHVLFGRGKVIETATFRRNPTEAGQGQAGDDLLIRDDNAFGMAHEDAARRDFTINALFYDPHAKQVLDWCNGMEDIRGKAVRTIGEPVVRFKEDPVRMLRAVKFCARLDIGIEPNTLRAITQCRGALAMAARPRLFEEILRLLRGGAAHRSIWLTWELGLLDVLLPELSAYLYDADAEDDRVWALLDQVDRVKAETGEPPSDVVLLAALLLEPLREACEGQRDRMGAAGDFLEPLVDRLAMPRRIADALRRIVAALPRLESGRVGKFSRTQLFTATEQVLSFSQAASPGVSIFSPSAPARPRRVSKGAKAVSAG